MSVFLPVEREVTTEIARILTGLIGQKVDPDPSWGEIMMGLPERPCVPNFGPLPTFENADEYGPAIKRLEAVWKAGNAFHDALLALDMEAASINRLASDADFKDLDPDRLFRLTQLFEPTALARVSAAMVSAC